LATRLARRSSRPDARWDPGQYNGYYLNNVWHYGPPPQGVRGVYFGYRPWVRGQRLGFWRDRYGEVDWRREHLRRPHRGYHWVRDDAGDFLLVAIATGIIADVILNGR
jgi:Ni/Co efflux regulator RcnB